MSVEGSTTKPEAHTDEQRAADVRNLARGSSLNLAGSFVAAALNLVLPVLITRSLSKDNAGIFFSATALFTVLINCGTVGADTGLLRALPRAIALRKPADLTATMRTSLLPPLALSSLIATALIVFRQPIAEWSTNSARDVDAYARALLILAPVLPIATIYIIGLAASRALGPMKPLVYTEKLGRNLVQVGAISTAAAVGGSLTMILLAWVAPYIAAFVVIAVWVIRLARRALNRIKDGQQTKSPDLTREFWTFSGPRAVSRIFSVALQRFDIVIVGALRGPSDAALYAVATRFPIVGLMFVQAIQQVMEPRISEFLARDSTERARALFRTTTCWLTLVSWPIYLFSVSFAPLILDIFGHGYRSAAPTVVMLCLAMLIATACGPVDSVLLMGGRSMLSLINTGSALVAMILIDIWLVPDLGVLGAGIGWTVGIILNNVPPLWQVNHYLHMHPFGTATSTAAVVTVVSFGLIPLAFRLTLGPTFPSAITAGLVASAVFVLLVWRERRVLEIDQLFAALRRRKVSA